MVREFFKKYPDDYRKLLIVFVMEQVLYFRFIDFSFSLNATSLHIQNFFLFNGVTILIGGFLYDYLGKTFFNKYRKCIYLMVFGFILSQAYDSLLISIGIIIFQIASTMFTILIFEKVANYFTKADSNKSDAFLGLFGIGWMISVSASLLLDYSFFTSHQINFIVPIVLLAVLLIGFDFSNLTPNQIRKKSQEHPQFIWILMGATILPSFVWFCHMLIQYIAQGSFSPIPNEYFYIFIAIIILLINAFIFMKKSLDTFFYSQQIQIGILVLFIWILVCYFIVEYSDKQIPLLNYYVSDLINVCFFGPILISILTHNYYGNRIGLVLGFFGGIPYVFGGFTSNLCDQVPNFSRDYGWWVAIVIALLFVFVIRSNRIYLEDFLRLNKPQSLVFNDENKEDPFDHLIEK